MNGAGAGLGVFFVVFFLLIFGASIAAMVLWVVAIVEVARIPEHQFRAAGTDKTLWILVVVLAQFVGALVWYLVKRRDVKAAAGVIPPPPAGWYPNAAMGATEWWDGYRWTGQRLPPAGPAQDPLPPG